MDVFLVKLDADGQPIWFQRGTGSSHDAGNAIGLDAEGDVYVSGLFVGSASFGSQRLTSTSGQADVFFVKYNRDGDFLWAFQAGGPAYMSGNGLGVDSEGSVYGTGFLSQQHQCRRDKPHQQQLCSRRLYCARGWASAAAHHVLEYASGPCVAGVGEWLSVAKAAWGWSTKHMGGGYECARKPGEERQVAPGHAGTTPLFSIAQPMTQWRLILFLAGACQVLAAEWQAGPGL
jgi:hypothetical protein